MKKICFVIQDISKIGGTERAVANVANILSDTSDVKVTIVSFDCSCEVPNYPLSPRVHNLFLHLHLKNGIGRLAFYIRLFCFFRKADRKKIFDYMIGTTHMINTILVIANKNIYTIGCEHVSYKMVPWFSCILRRFFYVFLDQLVVLAPTAVQNYKFLKQDRISVIPNPLSFISPQKSNLQNKSLISVGRLSPEKGYERLIHIGVLLKKKLPDWRIEIWGDGPEREKLEKTIIRDGVEDYVILKGKTDHIASKMQSSSICVMTSYFEALPMVLLEAMECGLPLVAYSCGKEGPCNVIREGYNGFLVPNDDCNAFVEKICLLANNDQLRLSMGKNSAKIAKKYTYNAVRDEWLLLFKKIENRSTI